MYRIIPQYPNYMVSEDGKIFSLVTNRELKPQLSPDGYYRIFLGKKVQEGVSRLVAFAWLDEPKDGQNEVAHNDGCRTNNHYQNLRWATKSENQRDRLVHGTHMRGGKANSAAFTDSQADDIRAFLITTGLNNCEAARLMNVSHETVRCLRKNVTYRAAA